MRGGVGWGEGENFPRALILEPQMAGGGLRGLDFIEQLTLIIVRSKKRGSFHCSCNATRLGWQKRPRYCLIIAN